jgi:hypothetical protein
MVKMVPKDQPDLGELKELKDREELQVLKEK